MQVEPYLDFNGRCEEALNFYRNALGAQITTMMRFKDSPMPPPPGSSASTPDKIMHSSLRIGDSTIMASDGRCSGKAAFGGISLTLTVATAADAERYFAALGAGGQVQMPLAQTFFSERFGMLADRFGVSWMIFVASGR